MSLFTEERLKEIEAAPREAAIFKREAALLTAAWRDKEKGGYRIYKDGNMWCAVRTDFDNLQESPAGFGESPVAAMGALIVEENEPKGHDTTSSPQ